MMAPVKDCNYVRSFLDNQATAAGTSSRTLTRYSLAEVQGQHGAAAPLPSPCNDAAIGVLFRQ